MKLKTDDTSLITAQQPTPPHPKRPTPRSPRAAAFGKRGSPICCCSASPASMWSCACTCAFTTSWTGTPSTLFCLRCKPVSFSRFSPHSCPRSFARPLACCLVAVQVLFAEVQLVYQCIFGNFMPISQVSMGENVITNFNSQLFYAIFKNLPRIILLLLPLIAVIACLALRKVPTLKLRLRWKQAQASFALLLVLVLVTVGLLSSDATSPFPSIRPSPM